MFRQKARQCAAMRGARPAVAERQGRAAPLPAAAARSAAKSLDRRDDPSRIGSDQLASIPMTSPSGPLGLLAQDQQRHAERRRFLLHPAGIAQYQVGGAHRLRSSRHGTAAGSGEFRACHPAGDAFARSLWDWAEAGHRPLDLLLDQARSAPRPARRARRPNSRADGRSPAG